VVDKVTAPSAEVEVMLYVFHFLLLEV